MCAQRQTAQFSQRKIPSNREGVSVTIDLLWCTNVCSLQTRHNTHGAIVEVTTCTLENIAS